MVQEGLRGGLFLRGDNMTQGEQLYTEGRLSEAGPVLAAEASKGSGRAMYCLGQMELFGLLTGRERPAEAAMWFRKGASDPLACLMGALFLRPGEGDGEAIGAALAAVEEEGAAGNPNALYCLSAVLRDGAGEVIGKDPEKACRCIEAAADRSFWQAEIELGLHYLNGRYMDKDEEKGYELLRRAAEKGVGKAQYHLAYCFLAGVGTKANPSLGASYYQKALRSGYTRAGVELGVYCEQGLYVKKDEKKAFQLYKKAADGGNADGMAHLADCYLAGKGTERNARRAAALYRNAAAGGSAYAVLRLGEEAFRRGQEREAFSYFMEAARLGLAAAQYLAGVCLLYGRGTAPDRAMAALWLRRAAQRGSREATHLLMQEGLS